MKCDHAIHCDCGDIAGETIKELETALGGLMKLTAAAYGHQVGQVPEYRYAQQVLLNILAALGQEMEEY